MNEPSRRDLLGGAMLAAAGLAVPAAAGAAHPADSLQAIAAARGLRFGSAIPWQSGSPAGSPVRDVAYAALVAQQCGLIVAENVMKWKQLRPTPTTFDFAPFDATVAWATRNDLAVRGHNLLWHQPKWLPEWLNDYDFGSNPHAEAERVLTTHIRAVTGRYGTRIRSYDVVNEAVSPSNGTLYETSLSKALGGAEATLDLAFRTARAAAPGAQLVYNDYMGWEPHNEAHRAGVLRLLEGFRRRNVPVDALGIQSHLITQGTDVGASVAKLQGDWRRFLDTVTAMGYGLLITELDVRDNDLAADIAVRDRAVADFTRSYLDVTLAYPQLRDVLVWGLSDAHSWIPGFEPRADRIARRPTPYDAALHPKPMRAAIADALAAARPR